MTDKSLCQYTGKVKYGHKETADKACAAMAQKGSDGLTSYQCKHCGKWHIGHDATVVICGFTFTITI